MLPESPTGLAPALEMRSERGRLSTAEQTFNAMRQKIREVFPDDDREAWQWTGEDFEGHEIKRPKNDFKSWLSKQYERSDDFTQRFVRRMLTIWDEMEREGFRANDHALYEHQKALFAWIAIETATGIREQMANLLVRSPYGSGKSLAAGLVVRAFREAQEELLTEGTAGNLLPTGILLGLRKEHMLQNAVGKQYAVLQPPYTVERQDIGVYWKNMSTMFGEDFSQSFPRPGGKKHPFYDLFVTSEEDEESGKSDDRLQAYLAGMKGDQQKRWGSVPQEKREAIIRLLQSLIDGKVILIPDVYNVPQTEKPLDRDQDMQESSHRYRGDSAYALAETPLYRVKATHRHLAVDRRSYTTQPNIEHPAQFCIAYGSMVTRRRENIRADVREEIMRRTGLIVVDEAGSYTPQSLGDSASALSGTWPRMIGFTGQDRGIDGWTDRSPVLSIRKMCELGLMKPIAFQGLGNPENPPAQGTEEAWDVYRKAMFKRVQTATSLKLPQPYEVDTVVIEKPSDVREVAHRILKAHEEERIPVKVWCFDPVAGDSRWRTIVSGFNAPKNPGDPRRILVAPPSLMAEALHLHAECYDIRANINAFALDQTRGRLGHIRNDEPTEQAREKARTYFRVQWLEGAGEPYIRAVARMMGFELKDEYGKWCALHSMIDKSAFDRDERRKGLSAPTPIPDATAVAKRKKRGREKIAWTPLRSTSPFVIERDRKQAEHRRKKEPRFSDAPLNHRQSRAERALPIGIESRSTSAPVKQPVAAVAHEKRTKYSVSKKQISITIVTSESGMPVNLPDLANQFGVAQYMSSLKIAADDAYHKGLRGKDLARAILRKLTNLQEAIARRTNSADPDRTGRRIGVRVDNYALHIHATR